MKLRDVLGWMEVGELEGVDTPHAVRLPWGELAFFGMVFLVTIGRATHSKRRSDPSFRLQEPSRQRPFAGMTMRATLDIPSSSVAVSSRVNSACE